MARKACFTVYIFTQMFFSRLKINTNKFNIYTTTVKTAPHNTSCHFFPPLLCALIPVSSVCNSHICTSTHPHVCKSWSRRFENVLGGRLTWCCQLCPLACETWPVIWGQSVTIILTQAVSLFHASKHAVVTLFSSAVRGFIYLFIYFLCQELERPET